MVDKIYSEDDLISVSALADFTFCERRAALHFIENIWEENVFTAEGTILHERVDAAGLELHGNMRIARSVWLRSFALGLVGKADVVEFHKTETEGVKLQGVLGLWSPFLVEYKRGHLRYEGSFEIQLCAQALCLEEMLKTKIEGGAIFYGKTRRRLEVVFNERLRVLTDETARRLHEFIRGGQTPKPVYAKKCESCSLISVCMPKTIGKSRPVQQYLEQQLREL